MEVVEAELSVADIMATIKDDFKASGSDASFKCNKPLRFLERSLTHIIKSLLKNKERHVDVECDYDSDSYSHFISTKVTLFVGSVQVNFYISEVLGNCSTVSIHHFKYGNLVTYDDKYEESGVFETHEQFVKFMLCLETILGDLARYSNMFYTISRESDNSFQKYCFENAKQIDEFTSKRNSHKITYYSKRL